MILREVVDTCRDSLWSYAPFSLASKRSEETSLQVVAALLIEYGFHREKTIPARRHALVPRFTT